MNGETIADIVAEFRELARHSPDGIIAVNGNVIANRLEAAWKREKGLAQAHCNLLAKAVEYHKNKPTGNAAAMLEALEKIDALVQSNEIHTVLERVIHVIVQDALSAPPRNCDCYDNEDEVESAYREFRQREVDKVPLDALDYSKETGKIPGKIKWLLAPAAERKGDK